MLVPGPGWARTASLLKTQYHPRKENAEVSTLQETIAISGEQMGRVHVPTAHANWASLKKTLNTVHEIPIPPNCLAIKKMKPIMLALHVCWELLPKLHVSCREQYYPTLQAPKQ